jgi:RNA-directed DNA polymerase
VLVAGTRAHAEALGEEVAAVLAPMGVRLSAAKTRICHIDEGFDFLVATRGRMVRVGSLNGGPSVMTA